MKKSFLHTFVVLSVFTIFVFGNISSVFAQVYIAPNGKPLTPSTANSNTGVPTTGQPQGNPANGNSSVVGAIFGAVIDPIAQTTIMPLIQTGTVGYLKLIQLGMWVSGGLFDSIIKYTIEDQSFFKGLDSSIGTAWKIVRDIANIVIVFSLLYLGIKTILDGNGFAETKILISIIIAAILINFSLVITQTVFNVSNIIGDQIGQQITFAGQASGYGGVKSISEGLMGMIRPDQIMATMWDDKAQSGWQVLWDRLQIALITGTTMLFLIVIFIGASILLMYRFLAFIVLMITAPVGITSKFVPAFNKIGDKWWSTLKSQAIVLPVFLLTLYISILFVAPLSQNLKANAIGSSVGTIASSGAAEQMVIFFFNYLLIIGFLLLPLIVPGKVGAAGSEMMTGAADWTTKKIRALPKSAGRFGGRVAASSTARAGRLVGGKLIGDKLLSGDRLKKIAQDPNSGWKGRAARAALSTGEGLKNASYDTRNTKVGATLGFGKGIESYNKAVESTKKKLKEREEREKKIFGFDKPNLTDKQKEDNKMLLAEANASRDAAGDYLENKKTELKAAKARNASQDELSRISKEVIDAEKDLEGKEKEVGKLMDTGKSQYMDLMKQRQERIFGLKRYSTIETAAFEKYGKDIEKEWKEKGKYKSKVNKNKEKNKDKEKDEKKVGETSEGKDIVSDSGGKNRVQW